MNSKIITIFTGIIIIILMSNISAFGISSKYWRERPLELTPGGSEKLRFTIQNMAGEKDLLVETTIEYGEEIIKFIDKKEVYDMPLGTKVDFYMIVTVPNSAKVKDVFSVKVVASTIDDSSQGEFTFGQGVGKKFDVIVIPTIEQKLRNEKIKSYIPLAIGLIILIILIVLVIYLKKKKK